MVSHEKIMTIWSVYCRMLLMLKASLPLTFYMALKVVKVGTHTKVKRKEKRKERSLSLSTPICAAKFGHIMTHNYETHNY